MKVKDLITSIEKYAILATAADWDNSGLQVIAKRENITCLGLCLDPTAESIAKALNSGADFILTHHPLLLKAKMPNKLDNYYEVLQLLLKADVALYAAHTSLDVNLAGPAGWLARALNLSEITTLEAISTESIATTLSDGRILGYGLVGNLAKAMSLMELLEILGQYFACTTATITGKVAPKIKRLAYCTGSGSSLWYEAYKSGADLFLTGDLKYHTALETQIPILDVGHHALEEVMTKEFAKLLQADLPEIKVVFIESESPFKRALP